MSDRDPPNPPPSPGDDKRAVAHAAWFVRPWPRVPLLAVLALGSALSLVAVLSAVGHVMARGRMATSGAAFAAQALPEISDAENAAVAWRTASKLNVEANLPYAKGMWRDPATFAPGGALRTNLATNRATFKAADRAATIRKCRWGLPYDQALNMTFDYLVQMRGLLRTYRNRIIVSAQDNDWRGVEQSARTTVAGPRSLMGEPTLIAWLVFIACEGITVGSIEDALAAPGAEPSVDDLRRLRKFARDQAAADPLALRAFESELLFGRFAMDIMASGEEDLSSALGLGLLFSAKGRNLLWLSALGHLNSAAYPFERENYERLMHEIIAEAQRFDAGEHIGVPSTDDPEVKRVGDLVHTISEMSGPAIRRALISGMMRQAQWRLCLAGLGALEYRLAHPGKWPPTLDDSPVAPAMLVDPCDRQGKRLRHRIDDDGSFVIWSVGYDGVDNGGTQRGEDPPFRVYPPRQENAAGKK